MNIFFVSCNNELKYGYVYDIKMNVPIENVKVFDADNNITSYTNKDGYFELLYTQNYPSKLIFSAKNYKIDTLPSLDVVIQERHQINVLEDKEFIFILRNNIETYFEAEKIL